MQSVAQMADQRLPRAVHLQVAIRVEDDEKKEHGVEYYFMRLIWTARLHGIFFSPQALPYVWIANFAFNFVALVVISFATFYEANLVKDNVNSFDIEISMLLCGVMWALQSVVSLGFLIYWQISGKLWKYFDSVIVHQKGDAVQNGSGILKRTVCFAHFTNLTVISMVLLIHYGPEDIRSTINKYEIFTNVLMKPLHTVSIIHVFMCWNTTVFLYNILIDGCYLEAKHFNRKVKKLTADSDCEYCQELVDLIAYHSRIAGNIRHLDKMMKKYAFVMVATAIPWTLLTLNMLANRVDEYEDFLILGLPSVGIIVAALLGITLAPARLYEELYRSKNYLCQNTKIWKPYREEVHKLAMVLASHMEQPNLGLSIWGFALLSKPFILALISVMLMVLSLVIEIVPTIKEFVEDFDEDEEFILDVLNSTLL